jgi:hypothetical protein
MLKTALSIAAILFSVPVHAMNCPLPVKEAAQKAYPDSKVTSCKEENEHGKKQYEVKLTTKESKNLELDISPEVSLIQTEERVDLASVPAAVTSAFAARYPSTKATKAEKQTKADGSITYELGFQAKGKKHEATFGEDGSFKEEE